MEYVIGYLAIGALFAIAYRVYFRGEKAPIEIGNREAVFILTLLWIVVLVGLSLCVIGAGIVDWRNRRKAEKLRKRIDEIKSRSVDGEQL